ncbi:MAG: AMP-binding protein [Sphaerochaetaceae bacterium]
MYKTLPQLLTQITARYGTFDAQLSKDDSGLFRNTSYNQLFKAVSQLAAGLKTLDVKRGDNVGLISDNRQEWLTADMAILALGAADVPRGRDAMPYEIEFILKTTESRVCFAENSEQAYKILELADNLPHLKTLILIDREHYTTFLDQLSHPTVEIVNYSDLLKRGDDYLLTDPSFVEREIAKGESGDTATIIFTSGTTGEPKGVVLSHENFLFQLEVLPQMVDFGKGERWLSVLPVWHSFERILQYVIVSQASTIAYSKPIGKILLFDLQRVNPTWMGSVPRIWEAVKAGIYQNIKGKSVVVRALFHFFVAVGKAHAYCLTLVTNRMTQFKRRFYPLDFLIGIIPLILLAPFKWLGNLLVFNSIKEKFGKNFRAGVSGGGSLPHSVDTFFRAIGVTLLEGYGLTETAPVIGLRDIKHQVASVVNVLPQTEIKILDDAGKEVPPGQKGVIHVRGKQVMSGYYKRPDLSAAVLSKDGWLNTGDIGVWTHRGEYAIKGRAKDTIVLSGGENVEPLPLEAKLRESPFIEQAVVVGQDQKFLGALIALESKQVELYLKENHIPYLTRFDLSQMEEVRALINREVNSLVSAKNGFKGFELIGRFEIITRQFQIGRELSAKQEVMRHKISEMYHKEIEALFA